MYIFYKILTSKYIENYKNDKVATVIKQNIFIKSFDAY